MSAPVGAVTTIVPVEVVQLSWTVTETVGAVKAAHWTRMTASLTGLRVLDLSWVMVGPMTGRYLADLGADVIKVESRKRIDPLRTLGPFVDAVSHPERTLSYHFINAGKRVAPPERISRMESSTALLCALVGGKGREA